MPDNSVETAAAEGTLNKRSKSQVVVAYKATQLYFRPETFEFIIVPEDDAGEFEAHGMDMCKAVDDLHQANLGVTNAVERYGSLMHSTNPAALSGAKKDYDKAQDSLEAVAAVLKTKLEGLTPMAKFATGGSGIVELIPLRKKWSNQAKPEVAAAAAAPALTRRKYGKKSLFVDSRKIKKSWKTLSAREKSIARSLPRTAPSPAPAAAPVPGPGAAPAPGQDSPGPATMGGPQNPNGQQNILVRDANGKHQIDLEKLAKQVTELKPELKAEILSFDEKQINGILFEWAEAMNKDLKWERQGIKGHFTNNVDLSAQAQLMRYVCGVGAEAAWDPKNGKVGLKAEAKGEFVLAEGKANMTIYAPHRLGWVLRLTSRSGKVYPLGAIRAQLEVVLAGVVARVRWWSWPLRLSQVRRG